MLLSYSTMAAQKNYITYSLTDIIKIKSLKMLTLKHSKWMLQGIFLMMASPKTIIKTLCWSSTRKANKIEFGRACVVVPVGDGEKSLDVGWLARPPLPAAALTRWQPSPCTQQPASQLWWGQQRQWRQQRAHSAIIGSTSSKRKKIQGCLKHVGMERWNSEP